jgi:hypothetical protein
MLDVELGWENLDVAFDELEQELTEVARGLTVRAFDSLLSRTPQFLGQMVASWTYSLNTPRFENRWQLAYAAQLERVEERDSFQGLWKGHPVAISIANAANAGNDAAFKLGDTVWFANGVDHGEGPYSEDVEVGNVQLRAVNLPGEPARRTMDWIGVRFGEISADQAQRLRERRLGGSNARDDS